MKKRTKNIANVETLDSMQMSKIKGGKWVEVRKPDGTIELVWV